MSSCVNYEVTGEDGLQPVRRARTARFKPRLFESRMFPKGVDRLEGVRFGGLKGDAVMAPVFKQDLHYGAVFVYMQRRFGFPNEGSDDYKELAKWSITTPMPDMILYVTPTVSAMLQLTFSFLAPPCVEEASLKWLRTEMEIWDNGMYAWVQSQGLPTWWESIDTIFEESERAWLFGDQSAKEAPFGRVFCCLGLGKVTKVAGKKLDASNWADERKAAYTEAFGPRPGLRTRPLQLEDWAQDDPLKPYALAARTTLESLLQPVEIRDSSINIYGKMTDPGPRVLPRASGSGSAVGCLANADSDDSHTLAWKVGQLGGGSHKRGLKRALALLQAELDKKPAHKSSTKDH